ncbi:MAG: DNA repair protein RecO [Patescibacteria group bacterium]|jgi:DNA repair protein RecO (recombination protein O)|nr:DNA repair protein RecO [Patescibacteria group bacterium]
MASYQAQGIVLKQTDHQENDQLFTIYTQQLGKVIALGRGTKKINSKLNSHLQPWSVVNLLIAKGKNYDHVAGAVMIKNFSNLRTDLKKIVLASFALEVIDKLTKTEEADDKIFNLLLKYLFVLDTNDFSQVDWQLIKKAFTVKLLTLLGFGPSQNIINDDFKLDDFLTNQLESELKTKRFFSYLS